MLRLDLSICHVSIIVCPLITCKGLKGFNNLDFYCCAIVEEDNYTQ